jgi:hypothetical protein
MVVRFQIGRKLILTGIALAAVVLAQAPKAATAPSIGGCLVFPADNIWNARIDGLPVDSNSAAYVNSEGGSGTPLHPDFGTVYNGAPNGWPLVVVPASQPLVPIVFTAYGSESDPGPYPIPADAPIEGGSSSTGDRHVFVLQSGTCKLYELFSAYPQGDGSWQAASGAVFDLTKDGPLRPAGWGSSDAAGLPVVPGLVRYDEVQQALASDGVLHHALRFTVAYSRALHIWPARHDASSSNNPAYVPMGQRFRLKAGVSADVYPGTSRAVSPINKVILKTLQQYGMFVADNGGPGGGFFVSGAPDPRWNDGDLHDLLSYRATDFEAVDEYSLQADPNSGAVANGAAAAATYVGGDAATQGNWTGQYGADGQLIANDLTNAPSYASVGLSGDFTYTWNPSPNDSRGLQVSSGSSSRIASTYYSNSFTIDVNLTDGNSHQISLYLCDWDNGGRAETISIVDASSKAVLSTQSFSSFVSGVYGTWTIKGHVLIQVTDTGGYNAIVNGIFFGGGGSATTTSASAAYTGADTTTLGNWTGKYGADGQLIANDATNAPSYANVSFIGDLTYIWNPSPSDPRGLQVSSGSPARIASTYYSSGFTIDVNLTDGNSHQISLYLCDWDNGGRSETISIVDAASKAVLSTQSFSSFVGGAYETWTIKGHVLIQVTDTGGYNAIVNAIFFGGGSTTTTTASAAYTGADTTTLGNWTGKYGADGQLIANDVTNVPSYANIGLTGNLTYTWNPSPSDPRGLQVSSGSSARIASTYYSGGFTIDLNLTDGNAHRISLYLCDWDNGGRSETISIVDAASKAVLSTQKFSSFVGGVYETWTIQGHVQIQVVVNGGYNAIVNGVFLN